MSEHDALPDEDQIVIRDCQQGNTERYRVLVEKYKVRAFHAALLFTGNREDALDLSQEAFYRAYKALSRFDPGRNFYTWLYQILRNICINHYHRVHKRFIPIGELEEKSGHAFIIPAGSRPDEIFEKTETREMVWRALNQLSEKDREILVLKEFNDFSYKEISEVLNIPIGSVMSRLFYARKKLGAILEASK
jgi:RNA polymerase sigma-70 factor (ECF subfamily)